MAKNKGYNLIKRGLSKPSKIPNYLLNTCKLNLGDIINRIYIMKQNKDKNKILAVWDFNERTGSIGEMIFFLEVLSILRFIFKIDKFQRNIDLCFINDNSKKSKFENNNKTYDWKKTIMDTSMANPHINSTFYFRSASEFNAFYRNNKSSYLIWPPLTFSIPYDNRMIMDFHEKNKFIPHLALPKEILTKIYMFYENKIYPSKPIVINIRNNLKRGIARNSKINEIYSFLKYYEKNKSYKFIITCNRQEFPSEFCKFKHVFFSKDYFDGIEYDLGLIDTSYISIFPSSGTAIFAYVSGIPFIQYGLHGSGKYSSCFYKDKFFSMYKDKRVKTLNYLKEYQRVFYKEEECSWLISRFEELADYLNKNNINNNLKKFVKDDLKYESDF